MGTEGGRDPCSSPLPREPDVGPGQRCRNRCRGVSPGLNDSELRPTGNRELSFRRCPPARVSSRRQRELWARRIGAGEGDPAGGTGSRGSESRARRGRAEPRRGGTKLQRGRKKGSQEQRRVWVSEGWSRRLDPVLALTLTHCVTSGEALPLPGAPFPHLLTGINDLSLKSPAAPQS